MIRNEMPITRVLCFVTIAGGLLAFYAFPGDEGDARMRFFAWYLGEYARLTAHVLALLDPSVTSAGQDLLGRTSLRIVKGCDAMDVIIPLASAIVVFPCRVRDRVRALPIAVFSLVVLNVFRICTLYFMQIHRPAYFETVHTELWPLLLVLSAALGFLGWANWVHAREVGDP